MLWFDPWMSLADASAGSTGGGGGGGLPPVDSGTPPASADYTIAKDGSYVVTVVDPDSAVALVAIAVKFSTSAKAEAIYLGSGSLAGYMPGYTASSSISGTGGTGVGWTFNLRRDDSWPKGAAAIFTVRSVDTNGNVLL